MWQGGAEHQERESEIAHGAKDTVGKVSERYACHAAVIDREAHGSAGWKEGGGRTTRHRRGVGFVRGTTGHVNYGEPHHLTTIFVE